MIRSNYRTNKGYAMLVAMIVIAILAVIGATSLSVSGVDHRIAIHNQRHLMVVNTADAGSVHGREDLKYEDPENEYPDSGDTGAFVTIAESESKFGGLSYTHNLGVYRVEALYQRCGNPPPGYSTELGNQAYRADYWKMKSTASIRSDATTTVNETTATVAATVRKVVKGPCKLGGS